jgi:hypothetical protein
MRAGAVTYCTFIGASYALPIGERNLDDRDMGAVRKAVESVLKGHETGWFVTSSRR